MSEPAGERVEPQPGPPSRNRCARLSLVWAILLLPPVLVLVPTLVLGASAPPFFQVAAETVFEASFCCLPIFYAGGLIPIAYGIVGLRAALLAGKPGRNEAIAGILLGLLQLALGAISYTKMAAGFQQ